MSITAPICLQRTVQASFLTHDSGVSEGLFLPKLARALFFVSTYLFLFPDLFINFHSKYCVTCLIICSLCYAVFCSVFNVQGWCGILLPQLLTRLAT